MTAKPVIIHRRIHRRVVVDRLGSPDSLVTPVVGPMASKPTTSAIARRPVGRPSKYPRSLEDRRKLLEAVVNYGEQGYSETEIAVAIGVDRTTMRAWANQNHSNYIPEFAAHLARAKEASQAWWEERARIGAIGTEPGMINAQVWKHITSCRYRGDYADRPDGFARQQGDSAPSVQINYIAAPQIETTATGAGQRILDAVIVNGSGKASDKES